MYRGDRPGWGCVRRLNSPRLHFNRGENGWIMAPESGRGRIHRRARRLGSTRNHKQTQQEKYEYRRVSHPIPPISGGASARCRLSLWAIPCETLPHPLIAPGRTSGSEADTPLTLPVSWGSSERPQISD
jgi:hypothetical protein